MEMATRRPRNVLGGDLESCCTDPMTGFYRDGYCRTGVDDTGRHTVCIQATDEFLAFSRAVGNDLSTPMPQYDFPASRPATNGACVCSDGKRLEHDMAPQVYLRSTHEHALTVLDLEDLKRYALDLD